MAWHAVTCMCVCVCVCVCVRVPSTRVKERNLKEPFTLACFVSVNIEVLVEYSTWGLSLFCFIDSVYRGINGINV